jgi:hypothetical protein
MPQLLSIISDQALPTLHFIKQFQAPDSFFLFVSTVEMEGKNATNYIMEALDLPASQCRTSIIDANDAAKAKHELTKANFSKSDQYLINLTGGNKLMSQMVFQHLQSFDSAMYYSPIASKHKDSIKKLKKPSHWDGNILNWLSEELKDLLLNQTCIEVREYSTNK